MPRGNKDSSTRGSSTERRPYLPSNNSRIENPIYYWIALRSEKEERRNTEHEMETSETMAQYEWVLSQCQNLGCHAYGGSEPDVRMQPFNAIQVLAAMPKHKRSETMENITEPLYRSSLACHCSGGRFGGKHKQVSHLGSRAFCLHP